MPEKKVDGFDPREYGIIWKASAIMQAELPKETELSHLQKLAQRANSIGSNILSVPQSVGRLYKEYLREMPVTTISFTTAITSVVVGLPAIRVVENIGDPNLFIYANWITAICGLGGTAISQFSFLFESARNFHRELQQRS